MSDNEAYTEIELAKMRANCALGAIPGYDPCMDNSCGGSCPYWIDTSEEKVEKK